MAKSSYVSFRTKPHLEQTHLNFRPEPTLLYFIAKESRNSCFTKYTVCVINIQGRNLYFMIWDFGIELPDERQSEK